jgi:hypothetical protein
MSPHRHHRVSRRPFLAPVLIAAVLAAGCQARSVEPPSGGALALRVEQLGGGPVPAGEISLPRYALYGDGTLIAADGVDGGLPVAKTFHLTHEAFLRLYDRAASAGLAQPHDYDVQAPDAPVLVITLVTSTGRARTRITAPDPEASGAAGAAVRSVAFAPADLTDQDMTGPPVRYAPSHVAVNAGFGEAGVRVGTPAWPLHDLGDGASVNGGRCVTYGSPLDQVIDLGRHGPSGGRWASGGATYQVFFRPLLPDENGCADLAPAR